MSKLNTYVHDEGAIRIWDQKTHQAVEAYVILKWRREWGFLFQRAGREFTWRCKKMFAGASLKVGHREDFGPMYLAMFLTITH